MLLDTHVLLWWLADDERLGHRAREAIAEAELVVVSAVSAWEIGIKQALGKLTGPEDLAREMSDNAFTALSVSVRHVLAAARLPAHHQDPFDRMLVAQANAEDLVLVTQDDHIRTYDVTILTA
ncbi:type II toxin-antitoxin system VapC family toxin [Euzebya sp.]|uniref:type II toxin-antitoxin system VapC family toxin n=1 Tax=Euzebya sp. TaxID=1971409 RepID=UPI003517BBAC